VAALALAVARHRVSRSHRVACWLAILSLGSLTGPVAWGDYVPAVTVWMLTFLPADAYRGPVRPLLLALCWVFCVFLPGVAPIPTLLPFRAGILLSAAGTLLLVSANTWSILGTGREGK
jgi:hypothetical protein